MLEQVFRFQRTEQPIMEKVVDHFGRFLITHGMLPPGQALPHHQVDADLHLIVTQGVLAVRIADQNSHDYEAGTIIAVPSGSMMEIRNGGTESLEFFAVKAPHSTPYLKSEIAGLQPSSIIERLPASNLRAP